ncbi:MAG: type II CRISPR RNA-guided endonuclease Cas9 [Oscillospiraceae bacterium]|nr:type II CRISPR RNA-guided endonuclease Cas9 [Oscillospiraceae bacterium]
MKKENYYIGLDIGTESVGWAVSDEEYHIPKFKGNAMWGIRLFDEAQDASARRIARTARRRLDRRKKRLLWLEMLFAEEVAKKDPMFFKRLHESSLWCEDKSEKNCRYSLFSDKDYSDKDYMSEYPTAYHLRKELLYSKDEHDIRLVFLALHHIIKSRGHFLYENSGSDEGITFEKSFEELENHLKNEYDANFSVNNIDFIKNILTSDKFGITEKKKKLRAGISLGGSCDEVDFFSITDALSGATVKFSDFFCDPELKKAEIPSFCLKNNLDDNFDKYSEILGERAETLTYLKTVFDVAQLSKILGEKSYFSEAKIALFEKNKKDLKSLKEYVKENYPEKHKRIFSEKKEKLNNFPAYNRYNSESGAYFCSQQDFCVFLEKELPSLKTAEGYERIYSEIKEKTFLTKLKGSENGVVPYQLQRKELVKILENASFYLAFLNDSDENGISVKDKIISIFDYKIPYYVGPLNNSSGKYWVKRREEKIYPWNFEQIVDEEASARGFIENLIGRCTYTFEPVLPKDSLLYSEFCVLNEINNIKINGKEIPVNIKQQLYKDLFVEVRKAATKKGIKTYFLSRNLMTEEDEISGIDDRIKSSLKSYHDFKLIIEEIGEEAVESIIENILVFGDDKKMLKNWIKKNFPTLEKKDIEYISRLKYKDWGNLSRVFLTEIYSPDENGEAKSIMDMLRSTNENLMQLLSSNYKFAENAEAHKKELLGSNYGIRERLDDMYIAPAVRRSVWQSLKIIDEIVKIKKSAPKKIFIEVARTNSVELKNKRTEKRKDALLQLYKKCGEDSGELWNKLCSEEESNLRRDKLYLYYTQFGKCMYSGEPIEIDAMLADDSTYDIDHIFPRSRIKDNSIDNRVLVKSKLNRDKGNIYPISSGIHEKMLPFWKMLREKGMISEKKFERLKRNYPLTDEELSSFVARQLVETQQSTKAIATLMKDLYPETKVVYSKAGNVADFKQQYDIVKCRNVNDLHHAKDAYLNIVVGNVYDTKFTENFFRNIGSETYSLNKVFEYNTPGAWDTEESIKTVRKYIEKNNILFTRMPYEQKGQLFDLNIMPAGKGQLPVKEGKPIEKYGGYNKISGAYFAVVEHTEKKKRIRSIEPIYIYKKDLYEKDPVRYCEEVLGLKDPIVIAPKIRTSALLELDEKRITITGRTGNQLVYKHSYQLAVDRNHEQYIKNIDKYIAKCFAASTELPVRIYDGISKEENIELFDWFCEKLKTKVYYALFANMLSDMENNREKFCLLSELEQCKLLMEILKAFKCDRQCPNFKALNGKGTVGIVQTNKKISGMKSAYFVNQSATGLYEVKTDLLK